MDQQRRNRTCNYAIKVVSGRVNNISATSTAVTKAAATTFQLQQQQQRCSSTNKIQKENLLRQDQIFGKETSLKRISVNLSFMQEVRLNLGKSSKMIIFGSLLTAF